MKILSKQTGETIIEVMMSVVILGFTMTTIYAIARRSLSTGQAASERSQVLAIVETQLERLRVLAENDPSDSNLDPDKNIFDTSAPFCIGPDLLIRQLAADNSNASECYAATFPGNAGLVVAIEYDADGPDPNTPYDDDTFNITSTWERVDSTESPEVLRTAYRLHPSLPPRLPQVSCGESQPLNITDYINNDPNASNLSFDAYYVPPQYNGDRSLNIDGAREERPESNPDFEIPVALGIYINESCEYRVNYTMWCTAPDRITFAQNTNCGNDQPNEVLRIRFWNGFTNGSCTGDILAFIDTEDSPLNIGRPGVAEWNDTGTIGGGNGTNGILGNGIARCMDVIHICELDYDTFQSLNGRYDCESNFRIYYDRALARAAGFPDSDYQDKGYQIEAAGIGGVVSQTPISGLASAHYYWTGSSVHLHDVDWEIINN